MVGEPPGDKKVVTVRCGIEPAAAFYLKVVRNVVILDFVLEMTDPGSYHVWKIESALQCYHVAYSDWFLQILQCFDLQVVVSRCGCSSIGIKLLHQPNTFPVGVYIPCTSVEDLSIVTYFNICIVQDHFRPNLLPAAATDNN